MILGSQWTKVNRHGESLENAQHWQISSKTRQFAFKNSYFYQCEKKGIVVGLNYNFKYHRPLENITIAWKITLTYNSHFWSLEWHFLITKRSVLFFSPKWFIIKKLAPSQCWVSSAMQLHPFKHSSQVLVTQSCLTLCGPMDYSLPGSSVRGILQTRILEWAPIPFSMQCASESAVLY